MSLLVRHRLALELALAALVAYLAAFGVAAAVRSAAVVPPPPADAPATAVAAPPAPLAAYAVIAERDVFNPPGTAAGRRGGPAGGLRLWGVALQGTEARAVIEDTATHHQDLYRVGEPVGDARVAAIDWDRVTLASPRGEETLELSAPAAGEPAPVEATPARAPAGGDGGRIRQTAENAWVVDRRELVGAVDNMSGLLTQLRAVAEVREGRPAGFRLFQIRDGSLFARLGLRNGDVVQRVNGTAIADPTALLGFLQRLGNEPRIALDIVRGDAPRTLVYDLR
ncbi:MAG TPA: type II secretion system protein GspC [Candidatus Binatia bacterium]|nr:type II secretion system protein GspC [Candidatus Binatia bacterium]